VSNDSPDIYWIDLNHVEKWSWKNKLSKEEIQHWEQNTQEIKISAKEDIRFDALVWAIVFWMGTLMAIAVLIVNVLFLKNGTETIGTISNVTSYNRTCWWFKSIKSKCTTYSATVELDEYISTYYSEFYKKYGDIAGPVDHPVYISDELSSRVDWYDQPISKSKYQVGEKLNLIINGADLTENIVWNWVQIKERLIRKIKIWSIFVFVWFTITIISLISWWRKKEK
jgi:hypothetical protein